MNSQRPDWSDNYPCYSRLKKKKKKEAKWPVDGMSIWIKLAGITVDSGFYSPTHGHIPERKPLQNKSQWTLHTFFTICLIVFVTVSYTFFVRYTCMEGKLLGIYNLSFLTFYIFLKLMRILITMIWLHFSIDALFKLCLEMELIYLTNMTYLYGFRYVL